MVLSQVFFGLPRCLSAGFEASSSDSLIGVFSGSLSIWPVVLSLRRFITLLQGWALVMSYNFSFEMVFG